MIAFEFFKLGTKKEFSNRFANPIMNGQHRDSTVRDVKIMKKRGMLMNKKIILIFIIMEIVNDFLTIYLGLSKKSFFVPFFKINFFKS